MPWHVPILIVLTSLQPLPGGRGLNPDHNFFTPLLSWEKVPGDEVI